MKRLLLFSAILCALLCVSCKSNHVLFSNGSSDYTIIVDPCAGESVQLAACELQTWIKEVSGAELPIAGLTGGETGKRLIVGDNELVKELEADYCKPDDSDDSFSWKSNGGDLIFVGGAKRGTLYSVYSFLEEELGCRWYSSTVSVAPKRSKYAFKALCHQESPSIKVRDDLYYDVIMHPRFSGRLRNNHVPLEGRDGQIIPFSSERFWGVHTFAMMVPPSEYFGRHPEYFSLWNGERVPDGQLCLSNPDVLRITIESMRRFMRENPDYLIYSLTQNDNQQYCQCPECQAIADQYGGQSGLMIWFVNQVADALKDEFPDKYIGTFAYQYTRGVPKNIQPRENVVVRLCSIECCVIHDYDECEQNRKFLEDMQGWSAIAPHLFIWDYTTAFTQYSLPVPNFKTARPHIQDFVQNNAIGMMEEGDYQTLCGEFNELKAYLFAKLMWNSEADPDAIIKDFTDGYYGPAGKYIREYIEFADRILRREGIHMNCYPVIGDEVYNEEFIEGAAEIFERAEKEVSAKPEYLARVESAEFPILLLRMEKLPGESYERGVYQKIQRIMEHDGVTKMSEWGGPSVDCRTYVDKDSYISLHDRMFQLADEEPWPAVTDECGDSGIAYTYYEGDFIHIAGMLSSGRKVEEGSMPAITIPSEAEKDHFGYDFHGLFKIAETGRYMFKLTSDDGAIVTIDGREVFNLDGSHSTMVNYLMIPLEAGLHDIRLQYFEDCEDQILELTVRGGEFDPQPLELYQP